MSTKKVCMDCKSVVDEDVTVCPNCCGTLFEKKIDSEDKNGNENSNYSNIKLDESTLYSGGMYDVLSSRRQGGISKSNSIQQKNENNKKIVLISVIVAVLLLISIVIFIGDKIPNIKNVIMNEYGEPAGTGPYTKGQLVKSEYINSWLGVKLLIPSGYRSVGQTKYFTLNNEYMECGLSIEDEKKNGYLILFGGEIEDYDEKRFLSDIKASMLQFGGEYTQIGRGNANIAGHKGYVIHYQVVEDGNNYTESYYAFQKDKRIVCIIIMNAREKIKYSEEMFKKFERN